MTEAEGRYHHGNLREALLEQAHALLVEEGISGVSLRQVAARVGVSRTAPYHHFPNKEALFAALVQRAFQQLVDDMGAAASSEGPVIERFGRMGRAYIGFALREPSMYRLMFGPHMLDARKHPDTACVADEAFNICRRLVEEGQASGEVGGDEPMAVALTAWSTVHGLATLLMDKIKEPEPCDDDDCDGVEAGPMTALAGKEVVEGVLSTLTHGLMQRS